MFCPKCAAQNADGAKYCRACGADISLVPEAMTGHLAERLAADDEQGGRRHRRRHGKETPSMEHAVKQIFMGFAFVFVAFCVLLFAPGGSNWWFWMFMPAFVFLGGGVGSLIRLREDKNRLAPPAFAPAPASLNPSTQHIADLPPRRNTGELMQPPASVTEATTRHLGVPAERQPKDV